MCGACGAEKDNGQSLEVEVVGHVLLEALAGEVLDGGVTDDDVWGLALYGRDDLLKIAGAKDTETSPGKGLLQDVHGLVVIGYQEDDMFVLAIDERCSGQYSGNGSEFRDSSGNPRTADTRQGFEPSLVNTFGLSAKKKEHFRWDW